jgi:hypothetical protein
MLSLAMARNAGGAAGARVTLGSDRSCSLPPAEELPLAYREKVVTDSKTELGFLSNGASKRVSRIISNPSKAPRGPITQAWGASSYPTAS